MPEGVPPAEAARLLALDKAGAVASLYADGLVIGADTVVVLDHQVLGKPAGPEEAVEMLTRLSGRDHEVTTGLAVVDAASGDSRSDSVTTVVSFARLSPRVISRYVATGEPLDKAGAYAIQGFGALLIEGIDGCYYNVVGLPLRRLAEMLEELGYDAFTMGISGEAGEPGGTLLRGSETTAPPHPYPPPASP